MSDKRIESHDNLFKNAFSRKDVMMDFLETRLPEAVLAKIDQNSLRLTNKSFVGKANLRGDSDVVFQANIEGEHGYLYILAEHVRHEVAQLKSATCG
ncbi:MAG: Rpn family recombination-promoting nuclease/putative transposase [Amoebophilaceae bacterium]|nr:Rpn family recombination-promoting nuclease/putative transposase [Amoebophilaceae bacterium]